MTQPTTRPAKPMRATSTFLLALATMTALGLTACGGGGGDSAADITPAPIPDNGMPAQANARINQSANAATALAREVEQRTRDLQLASGLAGATAPVVPAGLGALPKISLRQLPRLDGPSTQGTGQKGALSVTPITSELCSSGTASIDVPDALLARFENPNATLQAGDKITFVTNACVVKAAVELGTDLALGTFGIGATISGTFAMEVVQRNTDGQLLKLTYTGFQWKPVDSAAFAPLDAVITAGTQNGAPVFALELPGRRFLSTPSVTSVTGTITVHGGALRSALPSAAGSGYADFTYANWRYGTALGRAETGSVTVQGADGAIAVVTAVNGGYSVAVTVAGVTQTYSVGY